jgi:hypothetical protein
VPLAQRDRSRGPWRRAVNDLGEALSSANRTRKIGGARRFFLIVDIGISPGSET